MIEKKIFGGRFNDETHAIDMLQAHNARGESAPFPPARLLVYNVADG